MSVSEIGKRLQKYLEDNNITQERLAYEVKINQSQISRILNADIKRISKNVKRICEYANIDLESIREESNPVNSPELMDAIALVWDGTDKKAKALAKVIRSLKELSSK